MRPLSLTRDRKPLPPPRRAGRIAGYAHHHLARLRTITALLERGHTLGGVAEHDEGLRGGPGRRLLAAP
ncbi:hypothetical protein CLM85_05965, partial [Streptomyces albidoflavus]